MLVFLLLRQLIDLHGKLVELRSLGHREQEGAFELARIGIVKLLLD